MYVCRDPVIDPADDFMVNCRKLDEIVESLVKLRGWFDEPNVLTANYDWPNWAEFANNPVHESVDAQIIITCGCDPNEIVFANEYVLKHPPTNEWFRVGEYWTCDRLQRLNEKRRNISKRIENEFKQLLEQHMHEIRAVSKALIELDEACFYASYPYEFPKWGAISDEVAGVDLARSVYLAQCGFPVPLTSSRVFKWFCVSEDEPHDGVFSRAQWLECRKQMRRKWGEPFVF